MALGNGASGNGFKVALLRGLTPEREQWERDLRSAGRALPLPHRSTWASLQAGGGTHDDWFLTVTDGNGQPCGAAALQVAPSRALPGHLVVRCERFGPGVRPEAQRAALDALVAFAHSQRRVLRLHVETFSIYPSERTALEDHIQKLGFVRVHPARCYEHTLLVSLEGSQDEILASLHGTARRHIRAASKHPVRLQPVEDPAHFARLDDISRETYARTGGRYDGTDWSRIVALSKQEPSASRLVGLYRTDIAGPEALLAFAWGCGHGDHVQYSRSGSTRATDLRMPLMYPVVWDLICWARTSGARFFDFGGITLGSHDSDDPLGGISDFKRYFSERVVAVGAEWAYEPRAFQAYAAKVMSSTAGFLSRAWTRAHRGGPVERPRVTLVVRA